MFDADHMICFLIFKFGVFFCSVNELFFFFSFRRIYKKLAAKILPAEDRWLLHRL